MTDGARMYPAIGREFAGFSSVDHSAGEYVRHGHHHSNTVENYFSILKRGIVGTFHHVSEAHLSRYLAEFEYRFNRRYDPAAMLARLATAALQTPPMPYRLLKLAEIAA